MNSINLELSSFAELLNNNKNKDLDIWRDVVTMYNSTIGGCNCSKKNREVNAQNYFVAKIMNQPKEDFERLKVILNVNKIYFRSLDGNIFLEV